MDNILSPPIGVSDVTSDCGGERESVLIEEAIEDKGGGSGEGRTTLCDGPRQEVTTVEALIRECRRIRLPPFCDQRERLRSDDESDPIATEPNELAITKPATEKPCRLRIKGVASCTAMNTDQLNTHGALFSDKQVLMHMLLSQKQAEGEISVKETVEVIPETPVNSAPTAPKPRGYKILLWVLGLFTLWFSWKLRNIHSAPPVIPFDTSPGSLAVTRPEDIWANQEDASPRRDLSALLAGTLPPVAEHGIVVQDIHGTFFRLDWLAEKFLWAATIDSPSPTRRQLPNSTTFAFPKDRNFGLVRFTDCCEFDQDAESPYANDLSDLSTADSLATARLLTTPSGQLVYMDYTGTPLALVLTVKDILAQSPFRTPLFPKLYLVGDSVRTVHTLSLSTGESTSPRFCQDCGDQCPLPDSDIVEVAETVMTIRAVNQTDPSGAEQWSLEWRKLGPVKQAPSSVTMCANVYNGRAFERGVWELRAPGDVRAEAHRERTCSEMQLEEVLQKAVRTENRMLHVDLCSVFSSVSHLVPTAIAQQWINSCKDTTTKKKLEVKYVFPHPILEVYPLKNVIAHDGNVDPFQIANSSPKLTLGAPIVSPDTGLPAGLQSALHQHLLACGRKLNTMNTEPRLVEEGSTALLNHELSVAYQENKRTAVSALLRAANINVLPDAKVITDPLYPSLDSPPEGHELNTKLMRVAGKGREKVGSHLDDEVLVAVLAPAKGRRVSSWALLAVCAASCFLVGVGWFARGRLLRRENVKTSSDDSRRKRRRRSSLIEDNNTGEQEIVVSEQRQLESYRRSVLLLDAPNLFTCSENERERVLSRGIRATDLASAANNQWPSEETSSSSLFSTKSRQAPSEPDRMLMCWSDTESRVLMTCLLQPSSEQMPKSSDMVTPRSRQVGRLKHPQRYVFTNRRRRFSKDRKLSIRASNESDSRRNESRSRSRCSSKELLPKTKELTLPHEECLPPSAGSFSDTEFFLRKKRPDTPVMIHASSPCVPDGKSAGHGSLADAVSSAGVSPRARAVTWGGRLVTTVGKIMKFSSKALTDKDSGIKFKNLFTIAHKPPEGTKSSGEGESARIADTTTVGSPVTEQVICPADTVNLVPAVASEPTALEPTATSEAPLSLVPAGSRLAELVENGRSVRTFCEWNLIGLGGFGSVYRVKHRLEPDHTSYALKLVHLEASSDKALREGRDFREVATNRDLCSKYVVRYFTWWCEEPQFLPISPTPKYKRSEAASVERTKGGDCTSTNNRYGSESMRMFESRRVLEQSLAEASVAVGGQAKNLAALADMVLNSENLTDSFYGKDGDTASNRLHSSSEDDGIVFADNENEGDEQVSSSTSPMNNGRHGNSSSESLSGCGSPCKKDDVSEIWMGERNSLVPRDDDAQISPSNCLQTTATQPKQKKVHDEDAEVPSMKCRIVLVIQMEWCSGMTLRQWLDFTPIRKEGPCLVGETDAVNHREKGYHDLNREEREREELLWFKQLVKGLRDIHKQGVVHRDIKPENMFVTNNEVLKIGDFGLAKMIGDSKLRDHRHLYNAVSTVSEAGGVGQLGAGGTQNGQVIGTPSYAAPEGGVDCTEKADIYSAGLVLFELLSPPFTTVHEKLSLLANFRKHQFPPYLDDPKFDGWKCLLLAMTDETPARRPSAEKILHILKTGGTRHTRRGYELDPHQLRDALS